MSKPSVVYQQELLAAINANAELILRATQDNPTRSRDLVVETQILAIAFFCNRLWDCTTAAAVNVEAAVDNA